MTENRNFFDIYAYNFWIIQSILLIFISKMFGLISAFQCWSNQVNILHTFWIISPKVATFNRKKWLFSMGTKCDACRLMPSTFLRSDDFNHVFSEPKNENRSGFKDSPYDFFWATLMYTVHIYVFISIVSRKSTREHPIV